MTQKLKATLLTWIKFNCLQLEKNFDEWNAIFLKLWKIQIILFWYIMYIFYFGYNCHRMLLAGYFKNLLLTEIEKKTVVSYWR